MNNGAASPATLWMRVKAFALDYIVIAGYLLFLVVLGVGLGQILPALTGVLFGDRILAQLSGFLLITLPVILYFAISESSTQQSTWGKRKVGLRVIRTDGRILSLGTALARTLLKFLPWELSHTLIWQLQFTQDEISPIINVGFVLTWMLMAAYVLSIYMNKTHQALYDKIMNTSVVVH